MPSHPCFLCSFSCDRPEKLRTHLRSNKHNLAPDDVDVQMGRSFTYTTGLLYFNNMAKIPSVVADANALADAMLSSDDGSSSSLSDSADRPVDAAITGAALGGNEALDCDPGGNDSGNSAGPGAPHEPAPAQQPSATAVGADQQEDAPAFDFEDDGELTRPATPPRDAPDSTKRNARLASAALTPPAPRVLPNPTRPSAPIPFSLSVTPGSAPSYSSPTLQTMGGAGAAIASGFVMGPRPGDGNANRMRALFEDQTDVVVEHDKSVNVRLRPENVLSQPDPRSRNPRDVRKLSKLEEVHRMLWDAVYPMLRFEDACMNCYPARVPCMGHTAFSGSCPRPVYANILTVTVPHGGGWKRYDQVHGAFTEPPATAKEYCFKCWFLFKGLHRDTVKKDTPCALQDLLPPLLFMFWVNHSAMITSTKFFGVDGPDSFEGYWARLREPDDEGYPWFVRYTIHITRYLGVTQFPLPAPASA
ncbi:hypothetical protein EXIGLDRAFT_770889 [Exidia glandulosa HHB12029]|uniref:Uncharacterized protein n=1 Tax=Exidia glandulosa HHB12029 TaxID=1314781 RepID=A0A165GED2_EXIGL|nr:hypothetical protein EXIGLDRAFT_770889 [Exidia glandulosa HHB12029]